MKKKLVTIATYDKGSCLVGMGYSGVEDDSPRGFIICIPVPLPWIMGTFVLGIGVKTFNNKDNYAKKPSKT